MKLSKIILSIFIFLLLFAGFFHPITAITQDLGRHFLLGKLIIETKQVPLTNLFSYTHPDFPFINLHWFSEVVFYFVHQLINYNGLLIFSTLIILAAFSFVYFYKFKKTNVFALAIISLLYIKILFERTDIRPEIFSFLFLSIFIVILYKNREKYTRWIFILPLIELLWVNMHIYFIIGVAVICIFLIDQIISSFVIHNTEPHRTKHRTTQKTSVSFSVWFRLVPCYSLLVVLILSISATFFNPSGLNGALYPFHIFENYGYTIEENQNIFFLWNYSQKETIPYFVISAILLLTTLLFAFKKTKLIDWLLSVFFIFLAITAVRNFPLFVFATFIPFVSNLSILISRIVIPAKAGIHAGSGSPIKSGMTRVGTIIFILLPIIIFWQTIDIIKDKGFGFGVETGAKNATDFFLENNLNGPIFNNFDIGGYLDYRLYPKEKVFVDNRPGEYPASFFQEVYIPMQLDKTIFEKVDQKYKFNTIFFSHTDQTPWASAFIKEIINHEKWKIIYFDDYAIVLVKDTEKNQNIIKKFSMQKDNLKINYLNNNNFDSLIRLVLFFNKTELVEQEMQIHQQILSLKPGFCPSIYNLYVYLTRESNPAGNIWANKYRNQCQ